MLHGLSPTHLVPRSWGSDTRATRLPEPRSQTEGGKQMTTEKEPLSGAEGSAGLRGRVAEKTSLGKCWLWSHKPHIRVRITSFAKSSKKDWRGHCVKMLEKKRRTKQKWKVRPLWARGRSQKVLSGGDELVWFLSWPVNIPTKLSSACPGSGGGRSWRKGRETDKNW